MTELIEAFVEEDTAVVIVVVLSTDGTLDLNAFQADNITTDINIASVLECARNLAAEDDVVPVRLN